MIITTSCLAMMILVIHYQSNSTDVAAQVTGDDEGQKSMGESCHVRSNRHVHYFQTLMNHH